MDYVFSNDKPIQVPHLNSSITNTNQLLQHGNKIVDIPNELQSRTQYALPKMTYEDILLQKQLGNVSINKQQQNNQLKEVSSSMQYSLDSHINDDYTFMRKEGQSMMYQPIPIMNHSMIGNTIHSSLVNFNEQLKKEDQSVIKEEEKVNNKQQSAIKDIIDIMEKQSDERMANSSFLSLMKSLDKGDKTINEEKNTIQDNINNKQLTIDDNAKLSEIWNNISNEAKLIPSSLLPNQYYSEALKCLEQKNPIQALALLQADSINNPDNAESYYLQAKIHMDNGRDDLAIACAKQALQTDYFHLPSYLVLATCYSNELDEQKSIEQILKWLKLNTQFNQYYNQSNPLLNIDTLNNSEHQGINNTKYAIEGNESLKIMMYRELTTVLEKISTKSQSLNSSNDVLLALGLCYMTLMQYDKAQTVFSRMTEANPNDYTAWNRLGAIMNNNKQQYKAIEIYNKALAINPNYPRCLTNMGIAYLSLDDNVKSAEYLIKALNVYKDNNEVWNYLTSIFMSMNRDDLLNASMKRDLNTINSLMTSL